MGQVWRFLQATSKWSQSQIWPAYKLQTKKSIIDEWDNAVQVQVSLAKYPSETASVLHSDMFWFFLKDEEFVSKTINDSSIDLEMFPASKVR